jgi:PTH2 family peptidyl-tRNA hydrolase
MPFDYKLVVAVRTDLKLSKGKLAVQVAHASVDCALRAKEKKRDVFGAWSFEGQKKVVVKVKNLDELIELKKAAEKHGLITCLIQDAGLTEVAPGTKTCLGIGPAPAPEIDKVTGDLPLM